jgi:hypothetical protein
MSDLITNQDERNVAVLLLARGHTETYALDSLIWRIVHNAGRNRHGTTPRWAAVNEAIGCGSGVACAMCAAVGLDADEMVGNEIEACEAYEACEEEVSHVD